MGPIPVYNHPISVWSKSNPPCCESLIRYKESSESCADWTVDTKASNKMKRVKDTIW